MPELEKLIAMSRLFGVTVGGLLGVESPDEERDTSSQGAAEAADSDMASEAEAPAHELTDRELTAVEAIAEKYLAAQQAVRTAGDGRLSYWPEGAFWPFWWQAAP